MPDVLPDSSAKSTSVWARLRGLAQMAITVWALLGGGVLLVVVLLTTYSAAGNLLFKTPLPGDFEIVEVAVAIAAFAFLPYCELTGANVTADLFTQGAGRRTVGVLMAVGGLLALGIAGLLLWRMWEGMIDFQTYEETTSIHQFPIWMAFPPMLFSLALLILAAFIRFIEAGQEVIRSDHKGV